MALAGNPNVGKSTVFNALTGLHQHTGNWPGKTVASAEGVCQRGETALHLVDLPGTYSLNPDSPEEVVARDYIRSGAADVVLAVADATCLQRSLHLVLQIREMTPRLVVCVNLLDEAEKKGLQVDLERLSARLCCPVVGAAARSGRGLEELTACLLKQARCSDAEEMWSVTYRTLPQEEQLLARVRLAEEIGAECLHGNHAPHQRDRKLDRILTGRLWGIPVMLLLLGLVFYLTIWGANVPSAFLENVLFSLPDPLREALASLGAPPWLQGLLVDGCYHTTAWVVAVMLPPMAIFFPLFTLLEDAGYLPRAAFNLDGLMCRCGGHGRQSLTMCMGFGCNACGVTGCRIIDSPRERLTAQLTNSMVPCNGRFPTLIVLIVLFLSGGLGGVRGTFLSVGVFLSVILFSVGMTLLSSKLLSLTLLRGECSSFSLELPPYRLPQIGRVLVRSLVDRTLFVLGRAITVAAPAGMVIWTLANVRIHGAALLSILANWLQPLGALMGLDGMILVAFLLAFPANEIMLPVLAMGYLSAGTMAAVDTGSLGVLLTENGWTWQTAVCAIVLCLLHLPCGTTYLTLRKETGSRRWTAVGMLLPLGWGVLLCMILNGLFHLL